MREIATSRYDFAVLRGGDCVYVDKTDILAKLAMKKRRNIDMPRFEPL